LVELGSHIFQPARFHDAALGQQRHRTTYTLNDVHFMRDDQDGELQAAGQVLDEVQDLVGGSRVQCRRRFVTQQDVGVGRQGTGNTDALSLAAGQLGRVGVFETLQAHELQQLRNLGPDLVLGRPDELERMRDVACCGAGIHKVGVLEHHADAAPGRTDLGILHGAKLSAVDVHGTRRRAVQQREAPHQRGLTRSGMADDAMDGAFGDGQ
jgi:hypothetical protein